MVEKKIGIIGDDDGTVTAALQRVQQNRTQQHPVAWMFSTWPPPNSQRKEDAERIAQQRSQRSSKL